MAVVQDEVISIDPDTKMVEYKSGRKVPLSKEAQYQLFASPSSKEIEKGVKETELQFHEGIGNLTGSKGVNTFLKNLSDNVFTRLVTDYVADPLVAAGTALKSRPGQEDTGFFDRISENYIAQRRGRRAARQVIDQENPKAALAGKVGAIGMDIAMPLGQVGRSPTAVGALFGAGSSDQSLFEDPEQFAKSTAGGAALGYGLGKAGSALERVAGERRALREFPKVEKEAERAYQQRLQNFRKRVGDKIGAMQKDLGKFGIPKESMALEEFINREIGVSQLAGTQEGQSLRKFFSEMGESLPQNMNASDLQRLYEAVEVKIAQSTPEQVPILEAFKSHLVDTLPSGAAQSKLMGKIFPRVERETLKVVDQVFERLPKNVVTEIEREFGKGAIDRMKGNLTMELRERFGSLSPEEFVDVLQSRDASPFIQALTESETFQNIANLPSYKAARSLPGMPDHVVRLAEQNMPASVFEAQTRIQNLPNQLSSRIETIMQKNATDASILVDETQRKISSRLSNATGVQNPYVSRGPTNAPVGAYTPPQRPQVGAMAERFETQPLGAQKASQEAFGLGALGKVFGVPKIGAAIGAAKGMRVGLEGTLRGLTSPSALGNLARRGMRGGGMRLMVEQIASSYPSYENGIIRDPNERKQAVAEIEYDTDIPYEDKAMLQAYINRGKNLETLIRE